VRRRRSVRCPDARACLIALLLAGVLAGCQRPAPPAELRARLAALGRPHLVLVVVDTLRADWTTPYGFAQDTTPELARWAARGAVFEQVRAQSSWTKISVASLLTSLWPRSHAIRAYRDGLGEGALTLAEVLHESGYRTYGVQTNGWLHQSFGFHQGFERYAFPLGAKPGPLPRASVWPHADRVFEEAARLIDGHDPAQPMFLYVHFMDVHEYAAPPEFRSFGTGERGHYLSSIRWVDDAVERLREKLDDAGLLDRSVLVLAADHGETFGENGKNGHARNVLSAVISTPLVFRFPFPIQPVRLRGQVRNIDVAPTLIDLAGLPVPAGFEGRSLVARIEGAEPDQDRVAFAGLGLPLYQDASVQVTASDGTWVYARNVHPDPHPGELLFDRSVDPGENVNLIEREPQQAARMRAELDAYLAGKPAADVLATDVRIDPGIAEKLRAVGYLEDPAEQ
jgi:arylsulfatase A-like enzyme